MSKKVRSQCFSIILYSILLVLALFPFNSIFAQGTSGTADEIRNLTETGRLSLMLQSLELIRSRDLSGSEFGRLMSGINVLLIRYIYPDYPARLPAVDLPQNNSYTRIIREAENGNYIRPAADSNDFFEHILPFLSVNGSTRPETFTDILRDLAKASQLNPVSLFPYYFQGIIHEKAGRFSQAESSYRRAYDISNECYPALTGVARVRRLQGNITEAAAMLSDLMIRYPDSSSIKRELALTYYENRERARALSIVDELLLSAPRDGELLLLKARIHIEQGQFSQANSALDNYASINSNNRDYLFLRARLQFDGYHNRDSALNFLRSLLRTSSNDEEAMVYAAQLLMESQRPEDQQEGRALLARLQQSSASSVNVLNLSLQDAIGRENWQEAQSLLSRVLALRRTPSDLISAYYVERGLGNNSRALNYARELYDQDASSNENVVIYISALIDNNRRDEASRLLESRLNLSPSGVIKGQYYYLRSRIQTNEEAVLNDLRSSIFEDPRNLDALIAMFDVYNNRREERRAVYYLRQAMAIAPENPRIKRLETEHRAMLDRN